ncbi:hypothetical protein SPSYN_00009 [Sporotomaculum syntrophicum]|uniref:Uncharacterized protein n=1 Tax=Sporotomaculum syntrophicum TaxID=182264 RepID=A0A9D3AYP5_9FIRM|nr:hypothetical protein SPSYN_00009 [Sporotomaculum syntrophicum]
MRMAIDYHDDLLFTTLKLTYLGKTLNSTTGAPIILIIWVSVFHRH